MIFEDVWAEYTAMEGTTEGVTCPACHGAGTLSDAPDWCGIEAGGTMRCPTCRGTGVVPSPSGGDVTTAPSNASEDSTA